MMFLKIHLNWQKNHKFKKLKKCIRATPAVVVKIATKKLPISTLVTHFLKNTQTILFILLFHFI